MKLDVRVKCQLSIFFIMPRDLRFNFWVLFFPSWYRKGRKSTLLAIKLLEGIISD